MPHERPVYAASSEKGRKYFTPTLQFLKTLFWPCYSETYDFKDTCHRKHADHLSFELVSVFSFQLYFLDFQYHSRINY